MALDGNPVTGPFVWTRATAPAPSAWTWRLTAQHHADIDRALAAVRRRGLALEDVTAEDFPLPSFAGDLAAIEHALSRGPGFALVRGLDIGRYGEDDLGLIYWGIGAHLGVGVSQSYEGDKLGHVIDRGETGRYYTAGGEIEWHMDPVDVVGLLCLRKAEEGGESRIASSFAIHNAIAADAPAALAPLYRGYHYSSRAADRVAEPIYTPHRVPVYAEDTGGRPACFYLPLSIRNATRSGVVLEEAEREAMARVDALANRPEFYVEMEFEPGDMQFLNNRVILHGRTDYRDAADPALRRHLLRLWLMKPNWAPLRPDMRIHGAGDKLGGGIPRKVPAGV